MRQATIVLVAVALASTVAIASSFAPPSRRSRFLAGNGPGNGNGPKDKKCSIDPTVCNAPGSQGSSCCGDSCVNLDADPLNCGKCGKICKFTDSCCGGKCVDLNYDKRHCGGCDSRCEKGAKCYYGMCNYA